MAYSRDAFTGDYWETSWKTDGLTKTNEIASKSYEAKPDNLP